MVLAVSAVMLLLVPAPASADIRLTPFGGMSRFDGESKGTFGVALGFGGLFGVEVEAARILLGSYDEIPVVDLEAHATTYMANLVLRVPAGPIQPYGSAGIGLVRVTGSVDVPVLGDILSATAQDVGWNMGGGVYVFPAPNLGIRGDIRRFQTGDVDLDDLRGISGINDLPLPQFDFWRATVGVTFKF